MAHPRLVIGACSLISALTLAAAPLTAQRVPLTHSRGDDYIYGASFTEARTLEEKKTQNDVQLSLGFGLPLN